MSVIRSKFRVVQLSDYGKDAISARLVPVMPKSKWEPEGSEENAAFWSATPSGEIEVPVLWLPTGARAVGQTVYVDIEPGAPAREPTQTEWTMGECLLAEYSFRLKLHPKGYGGRIELGIDNPDAVILLLPHVVSGCATPRKWQQENGRDKTGPSYPWRVEFVAVT